MATGILNAERLREALNYYPDTGLFRWKIRTSNRVKVGDIAGAQNSKTGYQSISIDGKLHRSNRLAWLYVTGAWPAGDADHRNGVRADNRFENLRDVSRTVNLQNQRAARGNNRSSGLLGVSESKGRAKSWRASIKNEGRDQYLGRFHTKEEAHDAYLAAKRKLHEGCTI